MFTDFEYDGIRLSGYGYILCEFSSNNGVQTVTNGAKIKFSTVSTQRGSLWVSSGTEYEECLSAKFSICKSPCLFTDEEVREITVEEITRITRWLSRKEFKKFKLLNKDGYEQVYYEGSFNISRIMLNEKVIGLELTLTTNRPFGLYEPVTKTLDFTSANQTLIFRDISDEIGFINVKATITCKSSGNLEIHNSVENRKTVINNCTNGEVIIMDYPNLSSSISSHRIQDDFNYNFFRIANAWDNPTNKITVSLPCTIKFTYSPIRKVGI